MSDYFWPEYEGPHQIEHKDGSTSEWVMLQTNLGRKVRWHQFSMVKSTEQMEQDGYLGVRREPAAQPVEAGYYWPLSGEVGAYTLCHPPLKDESGWELCGDGFWRHPDNPNFAYSESQLRCNGYLGVRRFFNSVKAVDAIRDEWDERPAAKIANATPKPSKALTPDPDDANAAYAASVMTRLRAAKKPGEFERIALECVPVLCQMLGAE